VIRLFSWKDHDRWCEEQVRAAQLDVNREHVEAQLAQLAGAPSRTSDPSRYGRQRLVAHKRAQATPLTSKEHNLLFLAAGLPLPGGDRICLKQRKAIIRKLGLAKLARRDLTGGEREAIRLIKSQR
jgi:hypothetical protein